MTTYAEAFNKAKEAAGEPQARGQRNWPMEWVTSDCRNKLCVAGNVSIDDGKNVRLYRCPLCDRTAVPSAAVYPGPVEEWTPAEMEARMHDRRDVYYDKELRYRRGTEIARLLREIFAAGAKTLEGNPPGRTA